MVLDKNMIIKTIIYGLNLITRLVFTAKDYNTKKNNTSNKKIKKYFNR